MSNKSFAHLHAHSQYSMLDGAAGVDALLSAAAEQGMPAIASTDHGSMAGTYDFWKTSKKYGIKYIPGIELYCAPGVSRTHREPVRWSNGGDDDVSGNGAYTHMTALAETTEGMHNLFKLTSQSYIDGQYRKPRVDVELLSQHAKGVITTTGCPSGEVQTWLRIGNYRKALEAAGQYAEIFGKDNYFVELMDHGLDIEKRVAKDLLRLSKDLALPLLATNDLHYVSASDAHMHEALLCVSSRRTLDDPKRFKFDSDTFYLRTAAEMRELFDEEAPGACDNTLWIAERCEATFDEGRNLMPVFPVPDGETEQSWLIKEVKRGLAHRYPAGIPDDRLTLAKYEVDVICQMGFPSYFLVVADFINWAKQQGIRVGPGRGSAAGSIVAYALGITDLDPVRHGLMFERFLNPERVSMPDIDIDFDENRRGEVIEYVINKYGADRVANITTIMQIKAKAAIKDAARVLGYPYALGERINKVYPKPVVGRDLSLSGAYDPSNDRYKEAAEFRALVDGDPEAKKVVELAKQLEGSKRGHGMHAAGVIMSRDPISDHVPLMRGNDNGPIMTQFEYPTCEALGLLKMDFLGLSNLTTIDEALRQIQKNRNVTVDLEQICETLDDTTTFKMLAQGHALGVFQLDSAPIRALLRQMNVDRFEDISAVLALYRPGPMAAGAHTDYAERKNGRQKVTPIHPELAVPLADILDDTYGLIVYQEQVMAIAQRVAGYSLGQADLLRRAMGKKKKEILDKEFAPFLEASRNNGYSDEAIIALWEILVPFSDYAFNRAHTAGYGLISYMTAYLKANFPAEYMAALLTTNIDDKDKTAIYLAECRRMGVKVLAPDINESDENYTAVGNDIRVGLVAVKNVGHGLVQSILATREEHGMFTSFQDFLMAVEPTVLKKRSIESLVKAGAFDRFGYSRAALDAAHATAVDRAASLKKSAMSNQDSLFGDSFESEALGVDIVDGPEWDRKVLLSYEREMLGLYVSGHPLDGIASYLSGVSSVPIATLLDHGPAGGAEVRLAGLLSTVDRRRTKKGDAWAALTLEDLDGAVTVNCFPRVYMEFFESLVEDSIVRVDGRVERRDDGSLSITANSVHPIDMEALLDPESVPIVVAVDESALTHETVEALKTVLSDSPGRTPVRLQVRKANGSVAVLALGDEFRVQRSPVVLSGLKQVLGFDCLVSGG